MLLSLFSFWSGGVAAVGVGGGIIVVVVVVRVIVVVGGVVVFLPGAYGVMSGIAIGPYPVIWGWRALR